MKQTRKNHNAGFKAKVALAANKGDRTVSSWRAHLGFIRTRSTSGRSSVTVGIFAIPLVAYFLIARKQSLNDGEPYSLIWIGCYFLSLLFLATGLSILIRDAKRERKTGLYRFRR